MKRRTTPTLRLLALLLAFSAVATESFAAEPVAAMTDKARALYTEGSRTMKQGKYAEAYASLLAAWALNEHYQIAAHLGRVEVELGKYREAVPHLRFAHSEGQRAGVARKDLVWIQEQLERAMAQLGVLHIVVVPSDAEVIVDASVVGDAKELRDGVLVTPGIHSVSAKRYGFVPAERVVDVVRNQQVDVELTLETEPAIAPLPVPSPAAPPVVVQPAQIATSREPIADDPISAFVQSPEETSNFPRTAVIWSGIGLAAAGLAGGVVTQVLSNGAASDRDDATATLKAAGGDTSTCTRSNPPASCADILDSSKKQDLYANMTVPFYAVGGAALLGTVLVVLLTDEAPSRVAVQPTAGPDGAGLWVGGRF